MSQTDNTPEKNRLSNAAVGMKALTIGGEVGCLTVVIVLAAVFGGLWLDRVFGTKPMLTLLFLLASAPLALVLTFWLARRALQLPDHSDHADKKSKTTEGDKTGE